MDKYIKIESEYINDIKSTVTLYRHVKSGARLVTFENDDTNKVFDISFRTPAINSSGLTHILEHSVLCGSKKYPVKDPFLFLMKGSLNTFLNAFTYPDRTCYPVASKNKKDFENLMSVYCDAVFYPNVLKEEKIFRQEGWRYEIFNKDDPIVVNGVVYNEMKGALSDHDELLNSALLHNLFPDNCYQYESGGDPEEIPSLSYEEFVNFHKKYYVPSNSYIFLYGKMDMKERMDWLDKEYLSKSDKAEFDTSISLQKPFKALKEVHIEYPVSQEENTEHKTDFAYAFALKDSKDEKRELAIRIIDSQLGEVPGAPLKKIFLEKGLCSSFDTELEDDIQQPMNYFVFKGSDPDKKEEILKTYQETIKKIAKEGLNHKNILAALNRMEFIYREENVSSSVPRGLMIILSSLSTMVYDDSFSGVTQGLSIVNLFSELRKDLENGYFEKVLKEEFLDNSHAVFLTMTPSKTLQEEKEKKQIEKMKAYKSSLSDEEINELIKKSKELKEYQNSVDSPEDILTMPRLKKEDLDVNLEWYDSKVIKDRPFTVYAQFMPTNGISYNYFEFKAPDLSEEEIPYARLLCSLYGLLNTSKHSENELSAELMMNTGNEGFNMNILEDNDHQLKNYAQFKFSALNDRIEKAADLAKEIIFSSDLDNKRILKEVISGLVNSLESDISENGNSYAVKEALSTKSLVNEEKNCFEGLPFYSFLKNINNNFDKEKDNLSEKLKKLARKIFVKSRFFFVYTGEESAFEKSYKEAEKFFKLLPEGEEPGEEPSFKPGITEEGIALPSDVSYVVRGGMMKEHDEKTYGGMLVLDNIINNDYLWMRIRVNGGAYGVSIANTYFGSLMLATYRDPNIANSDKAFKGIPEFIKNMNYDEEEMLQFRIGVLAALDTVMHVSIKGYNSFIHAYIGDVKKEFEDRIAGVVNCTLEDLKKLAPEFEEAISSSSLVVIGKSSDLQKNRKLFQDIKNL